MGYVRDGCIAVVHTAARRDDMGGCAGLYNVSVVCGSERVWMRAGRPFAAQLPSTPATLPTG